MISPQCMLALLGFWFIFVKADNATEISQAININYFDKVLDNTEATVSLNASVKGALSFAAAAMQNPDTNFTVLNPPPADFDWTDDVWIAAAFDSLDFHAEIDINLHPSTATHEISQSLETLNFPFNFAIFHANLELAIGFHGWMNTTTHANLSYSFDVIVPPGSVIFFPIPNLSDTKTIGFNESKVIPGPLNSTTGALDIDFEYSFRPNITLSGSVDLIVADPSLSASIFADVPKLNLAVSQVSNVTDKCDPAPTSLDKSQVYNNLTSVKPSLSFDVEAEFDGGAPAVLLNVSGPALPTACLEFFPKKSVLASPSKTGGAGVLDVDAFGSLITVVSAILLFA